MEVRESPKLTPDGAVNDDLLVDLHLFRLTR